MGKEWRSPLYTQELLSFGKACELAKLDNREFGRVLGDRPKNHPAICRFAMTGNSSQT
jgi:hypothetical protein